MCHSISRGRAVPLRHKPPLRAKVCEPRARWPETPILGDGLLVLAQRFGKGAAEVRGDMSPRAASGGPIHARLAPGNSAMPALRMPRSDADRDSFERISRFRRALVGCWRCP